MTTFEDIKADYDVRYERAKRLVRCFCVCRHDVPTDGLNMLGGPRLCPHCRKASAVKGGSTAHGQPQRPVEVWAHMEADAERDVAEKYVREQGGNGLRFVSEMADRLAAGKRLTDGMVGQVMRSIEAEQRSVVAFVKREQKVVRKESKVVDLDRIYIGPEVVDGDYAVTTDEDQPVHLRIKRDDGFVVVTFVGLDQKGLQWPQPYREVPGYRQWYRGPLPHLVARLVANPTEALERFEEAA